MNDNDLQVLFDRADPALTPLDSPLDARAERDLERIVRGAGATRRPNRRPNRIRRWSLLAAASAAAVIVVVAVQLVSPMSTTPPAAAATPPLLEITPLSISLPEVVDGITAQLAAEDDPGASPKRRVNSLGWYLDAEIDDTGVSSAVIAPQNTKLTWKADRSGRLVVTAGQPYLADDPERHEIPSDSQAPAEGTVLRDEKYAAGALPLVFPGDPPQDATELDSYLLRASPPDSDASDYVSSVTQLLNEWTLTPGQHAGILAALAAYPGVSLAGETIDRAGRSGYALRVHGAHRPNFDTLVIIGKASGTIISTETVYLGGLPDFDVPAPAVTTYISWR